MNDTIPCPGCHTPLPLEATGCQVCMRGRSRQEIMRGYTQLKAEKTRRRRLPFQILAAILVAGATGKLLWEHRASIETTAAAVKGRASSWADAQRDPANYAAKPAGTNEPGTQVAPPVAPEDALRTQAFGREPAGTAQSAGTAKPPSRRAPAGPVPKNSWRVSGTVYDLATLTPVPGAEVAFLREEKAAASVQTDAAGTYTIDLPKGDGWTVGLAAPARRAGGVLDLDPPYRARDVDERRAAVEHITDGDLAPAAVGWKRSSVKVKLDLVAVPQRWPDPPQR